MKHAFAALSALAIVVACGLQVSTDDNSPSASVGRSGAAGSGGVVGPVGLVAQALGSATKWRKAISYTAINSTAPGLGGGTLSGNDHKLNAVRAATMGWGGGAFAFTCSGDTCNGNCGGTTCAIAAKDCVDLTPLLGWPGGTRQCNLKRNGTATGILVYTTQKWAMYYPHPVSATSTRTYNIWTTPSSPRSEQWVPADPPPNPNPGLPGAVAMQATGVHCLPGQPCP